MSERSLAPATPTEQIPFPEKMRLMAEDCNERAEYFLEQEHDEVDLAHGRFLTELAQELQSLADRAAAPPTTPTGCTCEDEWDGKCPLHGWGTEYLRLENERNKSAPPATQTGDVRKAEAIAKRFQERVAAVWLTGHYKQWFDEQFVSELAAEIESNAAPTPEPTGAGKWFSVKFETDDMKTAGILFDALYKAGFKPVEESLAAQPGQKGEKGK